MSEPSPDRGPASATLAPPATPAGADDTAVSAADAGATLSEAALIESLIRRLLTMGETHGTDIPTWLAQELTFGQLRLLFLLWQHGPAPMSRVADWLGVGMPAASGIVDRVERHGLATRHHRPDDRRIVECHLTDAGRALVGDITGRQMETMRRILELLTRDELVQLDRIVEAVVARRRATAP